MLFSSLCESYFTYFNDETQDKTSTKHKVINRKFDYNGSINEHFTGVYSVSKVLYTFPSASNEMCFLEKHFHDISVNLQNAHFTCIDTTNVNFR